MVESSSKESIHPILHQFRHAKPGDELDHLISRFFHLRINGSFNGWMIGFPKLTRSIDDMGLSGHFFFSSEDISLRLITVDATTASPRICIDESSDTFVCFRKHFCIVCLVNEWIWMSDKAGTIFISSTQYGASENAITSGDWVVRSVECGRSILHLLSVSGMNRRRSHHKHLIRVSFDGKR